MGRLEIKLWKERREDGDDWKDYWEPQCISSEQYEELSPKEKKRWKCHKLSNSEYDALPQLIKQLCVFNLKTKGVFLDKKGIVRDRGKHRQYHIGKFF